MTGEEARARDAAARLGESLTDRMNVWLEKQDLFGRMATDVQFDRARQLVEDRLATEPEVMTIVSASWAEPEPDQRVYASDRILRIVFLGHGMERHVFDVRFVLPPPVAGAP